MFILYWNIVIKCLKEVFIPKTSYDFKINIYV